MNATPDSAELVRSEERASFTTITYPRERVLLERFIVSEQIMVPVTVRHEEIRVTTTPLDSGDSAENVEQVAIERNYSDTNLTWILHEERPVVSTEVVAVELVRLGVTTVTHEQLAEATVRSEVIDIDTMSD